MFLLFFFFFFCWSHEVFTPTAPQSVSPLSMVIQHGMLWSIMNTPLINTHTATPASWFISLKKETSGCFRVKAWWIYGPVLVNYSWWLMIYLIRNIRVTSGHYTDIIFFFELHFPSTGKYGESAFFKLRRKLLELKWKIWKKQICWKLLIFIWSLFRL